MNKRIEIIQGDITTLAVDAVVLDHDLPLRVAPFCANHDFRVLRPVEFYGIADQVLKQLHQLSLVAEYGG